MAITRRFDDFRPLDAKFTSIADCGHTATKGTRIGYSRGPWRGAKPEICCASCYSKWEAENDDAARMESCGGY